MSLSRAEAAGEAGMEQALRAERVRVWKTQAQAWLDEQRAGRVFTADDLVAAVGLPDSGPGRNNVVGAWTGAQSKAGRIEFTGELRKSSREAGHGNLQRVWQVLELEETPTPCPFDDGVSSSPSDSSYPTQRVEATTTPEARGGWDEPRHPEADAATASLPPLRAGADASADGVRAETRLEAHVGEGDPGSALNADAPPGGPPEMDYEPGWLLRSLQAEAAA